MPTTQPYHSGQIYDPNVVAVGSPCRVLREIGEHDREYFYKNERIDWEKILRKNARP